MGAYSIGGVDARLVTGLLVLPSEQPTLLVGPPVSERANSWSRGLDRGLIRSQDKLATMIHASNCQVDTIPACPSHLTTSRLGGPVARTAGQLAARAGPLPARRVAPVFAGSRIRYKTAHSLVSGSRNAGRTYPSLSVSRLSTIPGCFARTGCGLPHSPQRKLL